MLHYFELKLGGAKKQREQIEAGNHKVVNWAEYTRDYVEDAVSIIPFVCFGVNTHVFAVTRFKATGRGASVSRNRKARSSLVSVRYPTTTATARQPRGKPLLLQELPAAATMEMMITRMTLIVLVVLMSIHAIRARVAGAMDWHDTSKA